jgi:AbrB family looped-hinge helix DNA binding protein
VDRTETAHVRSNGQVTLPAQVRRAAELKEGDIVEVALQDDGTIQLRPVAVLDRLQADLRFRLGDQAGAAAHGPAPDGEDIRERARGLVRRRGLPLTTGRALESLVERFQRAELTLKAFIAEAVMLGLPADSISALLGHGQGHAREDVATETVQPADGTPAPDPTGRHVVHIAQAVHSLLYLPLYIAHDVGFFEEEGVQVEITTCGGGTEAWSAVEAGVADYGVHDPVFAVRAFEQGVTDAVVVGALCNGQAILALAADESVEPTEDPYTFMTETLAGRTVATQPQPDSQWALLRFLRFLYQPPAEAAYRNLQVPIGTEAEPVHAGQADLCLAFPPQADAALADGLHEVFDFSRFFGPYLLSALTTRRGTVQSRPAAHEAVVAALEKACQYAHAFPREAVRVARQEFPDVEAGVIEQATLRCLRRNFLPRRLAVDAEAWQENGVLNKFVGTLRQYRPMSELVDNETARHVYRALGNLQLHWDGPRRLAHCVRTGLTPTAEAVPQRS